MNTNNTIVNLDKVAYANFFWSNGKGNTRFVKPDYFTVNGQQIDAHALARCHDDWPRETEVERAKRLMILDVWYPVIVFQLSNSHSLKYTGKRALALRDAWNAKVFGQAKKRKK